jgi:hypothetical protein
VGTTYFVEPIPPIEANTVRVPAGPVTIGLEMRLLNPSIVRGFYDDRPDRAIIEELIDGHDEIDDNGPSIHIFGTDDGLEYLRFDCFENGPHYHYVHPREDHQVVHSMDPVAIGDPFEWVVETLKGRMGEMLRESGGTDLADRLDEATVAAALEGLVKLRATAGDAERS